MKNLIKSTITIDEAGGNVKLTINPKIYSLETIYAAGYLFLDKVYLFLDEGRNKNIDIYLFAKDRPTDLKKIAFDFSNELLNYCHYFSSAKTNAESIKLILQRALFSASPSLIEQAEEQEIKDILKDLEKEESGKK